MLLHIVVNKCTSEGPTQSVRKFKCSSTELQAYKELIKETFKNGNLDTLAGRAIDLRMTVYLSRV